MAKKQKPEGETPNGALGELGDTGPTGDPSEAGPPPASADAVYDAMLGTILRGAKRLTDEGGIGSHAALDLSYRLALAVYGKGEEE